MPASLSINPVEATLPNANANTNTNANAGAGADANSGTNANPIAATTSWQAVGEDAAPRAIPPGEDRGAPLRVVIIGAGLTGLTAANALVRACRESGRPLEIQVLDAKNRVGGAIWTERKDGFMLEGGADSFITNKPWAVDLCRDLGLGDELISIHDKFRRSFVVRNGKLHAVPEGFVLMAPGKLRPLLTSPILSWRGKFRMLMDLVIPRQDDDGDESLASFVRRRFGREALERLIQPLIGGIYTADPAELSLKATLPQFMEMERTHGSIIRAALAQARAAGKSPENQASGARYGLFATLRDGMGTLPHTLAQSLPFGALRLETPVRRIMRQPQTDLHNRRPWRVELLDGPAIDASAVIIAVEAHAAARLVDGFDTDLAQKLRAIPYASSAIANLAFRRDQIAHPLHGFGAVVPLIEGRSILAVSFTSVKFPTRAPEGHVLMRVFVGGATQPELFNLDDNDTLDLILREITPLLGVTGKPLFSAVARHARAMPQYTIGHLDRVSAIRDREQLHPHLILTGNAYHGVGVPDCIRAGQNSAQRLLQAFSAPDSVPVPTGSG